MHLTLVKSTALGTPVSIFIFPPELESAVGNGGCRSRALHVRPWQG